MIWSPTQNCGRAIKSLLRLTSLTSRLHVSFMTYQPVEPKTLGHICVLCPSFNHVVVICIFLAWCLASSFWGWTQRSYRHVVVRRRPFPSEYVDVCSVVGGEFSGSERQRDSAVSRAHCCLKFSYTKLPVTTLMDSYILLILFFFFVFSLLITDNECQKQKHDCRCWLQDQENSFYCFRKFTRRPR